MCQQAKWYVINGEVLIGKPITNGNSVTVYTDSNEIAFTLEAYNKLEKYSRLAQALNSPYLTEKYGRLHV